MNHVTCCILRLNQYRLEEADGEEISIYYKGHRVWPAERYKVIKSAVTEINLRLTVELNKDVRLDLYEYDWFIFKKRIGSFLLRTDTFGGPYNTDLSLAKYKRYNLEWLLF